MDGEHIKSVFVGLSTDLPILYMPISIFTLGPTPNY